MPESTHRETVTREFTRQASTFADPRLNTAFTSRLTRLVEFAGPCPDDVCLDAAGGTGLVARALSPSVRHVTALDTTPAMLAQGKADTDRDGVGNVTFCRADVAELPYADQSFTLVITRFSLHHFEEPLVQLRELVRVTRPGGRLIVADIVRPDCPGDPDRIERLRDPSHTAMLSADKIADLLAAAGADVRRRELFDVTRPLEQWLEQSRTPEPVAARIRAELADELAAGPVTGMRPLRVDGELWFTHSHAHTCALAR